MEPFNVLTQTRHGQMLVNRHDVYIGRSLTLYGEWSEGEIALFLQVLRPGMVVVDAGANIGTHTVAMARAVAPNGVVYAFEPQRIVFQTLAANIALNSLANVFCSQRALGEAPGIARVPALDYTIANNFGGVELAGTDAAGEPVDIARIDDFELPTCHLIKIDVEGMELAVLKGAAETIARCQPLLYVEADRADRRDEVIGWLDARGYVMYWHQVPLYNPANAKANPTNVFEGVVSLNVLAIPASVPQSVAGLERVIVPKDLTPPAALSGAARGEPGRQDSGAVQDGAAGGAPGEDGAVGGAPGGVDRSVNRSDVDPPARRRVRAARTARLPLARARQRISGGEGTSPAASPDELRPMLERALAHHQAGRIGEAVALYEAVLAANPDEPDALHLLGLIRRDEQHLDDALRLIGRAAGLMPTQPLFQFNLGMTRRQLGLLPEAESALRQTLELSPDSVEAHLELGLTLLERRQLDKAEAMLRAGLALAPEHAMLHFGLSELLLLAGRYREGWQEYTWRRQLSGFRGAEPAAEGPRWNGQPLAGRTILLEGEQGHGDTLLFVRYAPLVAERGGRVVLRCRPEVQSVLRTVDGVEQIVSPGEPLPPLDYVASLPDLPRIFGTTVQTIPSTVPYVQADPERQRAWAARFAAEATQPARRVGLVWAGSPDHRLNGQRSTTLAALAPLGAVPGVRFYGLQKGPPAVEALTPPAGMDFVDLGPELTDFGETAAAVCLLDLVITVDTSVAHLAGALGRPAWVLPWATHDWRWLLGRDDSPWYPSIRLFRQETPNAWGPVVARVAVALRGAVE
jgi:FkbM family methyltransferase